MQAAPIVPNTGLQIITIAGNSPMNGQNTGCALTVDPNQTLRVMRQEENNLQTGTIMPRGLDQVVQSFITDYFLKNETNADQANQLARAQLYQGDWRHATQFADELREVTPDDVRRVARTYIKNLRFAYVGDPSKLDRSVLTNF